MRIPGQIGLPQSEANSLISELVFLVQSQESFGYMLWFAFAHRFPGGTTQIQCQSQPLGWRHASVGFECFRGEHFFRLEARG